MCSPPVQPGVSWRIAAAACCLTIDRDLEALSAVLSELKQRGVVPVGLSSHQATLDDVFLHLTGKELAHD